MDRDELVQAIANAIGIDEAEAVLDLVLGEAAKVARDYTPEKHDATLAAHVTGRNIERAILALTSKGTRND